MSIAQRSSSLLQQSRPAQDGQEITLHFSKLFPGNGRPGHKHEINGMFEFQLMQTKRFPQESSRPRALHGFAHFAAGDHSQAGSPTSRKVQPIRNETSVGDTFSLYTGTRKIAPVLDAVRTRKTQFSLSPGAHLCVRENGGYAGVNRLRPTRRLFERMPRPLLVVARARKPCCRLRRILDG
jgi:hypothetical protein